MNIQVPDNSADNDKDLCAHIRTTNEFNCEFQDLCKWMYDGSKLRQACVDSRGDHTAETR